MNLKKRILLQTLTASLAFTLLLSAVFFFSVANIRNTALANSGGLGNNAAAISAYALEIQLTDKIVRMASDTALILAEKMEMIENHTRMTADIAGTIYTRREAYRPHPLPVVPSGRIPPAGPYLHAAPGVDLARIRGETDLAGNIGDVLRQITVVDRGITTSTIGGESGYVIAMDLFPWPQADFDPRLAPWYRGAREKDGLYWTEVYADLRGRGPAVSCAAPFYDQSGDGRIFKGVARSTVMLSDFAAIIDSAKVGRTGYLFLLDQRGIKLFSSGSVDVRAERDGGISGENYLESSSPYLRSLAVSMTLGASGITELEIDGVPVYAAYAPIPNLGWSLGVAIPVQEVSVPAWLIGERIHLLTGEARTGMDRRILFTAGLIALTMILTLLATAFLSVRFTATVTAPILALNEGVREVSGGNLDREVRIKTGDELEELALSFNTMKVRLREQMAETTKAAQERQRIDTELDVAARIQMSMLPCEFPPLPGRQNLFDLYAVVHPAKEVGGDFYDFFFIDDDHLAVLAADVSGKGIPAALFMAITKALIKNQLQSGEAPEDAMGKINRQLCNNNIENMFVTLWMGILELSSGRLEYINAGHNPPLLKSGGGDFIFLLSPPDLVLAGMEDTRYRRRETRLNTGDTLFLYTDGIPEAADREETFSGKERLRDFLNAQGESPLRKLLPALFASIEAFAAGTEQSDDITMLALRMTPADKADLAEELEMADSAGPSSITLTAGVEQLEELTAFVGAKLDRALCPDKVRGQIELACEEIFVNIARYAYPDKAAGAWSPGGASSPGGAPEVMVQCVIEEDPAGAVMTLTFIDWGAAFNPLDHADPDIGAPLEKREVGGLGLLIVKRTMDSVRYSYGNGINRLVITKSWPV